MIVPDIEDLAMLLKALADPVRLQIIQFIGKGERFSSDIVDHVNKSQSTVSQHVSLLVASNILKFRKDGTKKYYSIQNPVIFDVLETLMGLVARMKRDAAVSLTQKARMDTLL